MFALAFFTYLSCFLLLTAPILYLKKQLRKQTAIFSVLCAILTIVYGYIHERDHQLYEINIPVAQLKKPLDILQYTDVHLGMFQDDNILNYLVKKANKIKPDILIITGDLIDGAIGLDEKNLTLLKKIQSPTYFVSGNHDDYVDSPALEKILMKNGIHVLNNEIADLGEVKIVGLEFMRADADSINNAPEIDNKNTVKSTLQKLKPKHDKPLIFAMHNPVGIDYLCNAGADLILAGHTHAGQFFPFNLIVKALLPYSKGLYIKDKCSLYVSQGVGAWGPPIRVGTNSEITLFHLTPEK